MFARPHPRLRVTTAAACAALAGVLLLSACSNSSGGSGGPSSGAAAAPTIKADPAIAALLPAKIKDAGKLVVGVNVPYTPNEYLDNGKVAGFDVDLLDAVAKVLGLTTDYRQADFEKIIPAVTAGTYDVGMSSFTDSKEREQTVDFVTYFSAGILWAGPAGKSVDPTNPCGMTVSVQTNTVEDTDELPALNDQCTSSGQKPITVLKYDNQDDATNAVILGKADAMTADSPVTGWAIKQSGGKLAAAGVIKDSAPYGWPVAKGSQLAVALQRALQSLIDSGAYTQIVDKWGADSGAIQTSVINGALS